MSELKRYKDNPFLDTFVIKEKTKQVSISPLGKDNNILVNQITGEITGTSIVTYRRVDEQEFVKVFTDNIALTFGLTSAGIKVFNVLMYAVQKYCIGKDRVSLDSFLLNEFLEKHNDRHINLSISTFKRGLNELEKTKIIAKTVKQGDYFINPNFIFNGNRIAFSTIIEKAQLTEDKQITIEEQINKK